jgi:hypothetical protein
MEYITIKRSDKDFESYLMGFFSNDVRALPVENLNISSTNEVVTFKLENLSNLKLPSYLVRLLELLRLENLTFVLVPYFVVLKILRLNALMDTESWILIGSVGVALSFLMMAYNLRNDLQDHRIGLDRINPRSGSRALQKGWFTGRQVQNISWVFIFLSALIATPIIFKSIQDFRATVGFLTFLAIVLVGILNSTKSNIHSRFSLRLSLIGFLLSGPLLTFGAEWILAKSIHIETVIFGVVWGLWVVLLTQVKNFQSLMAQVQAGVSSWMTRSGFDQISKALFIAFVVMQLCFGFIFYSFGNNNDNNNFIVFLHILAATRLSLTLFNKLKKLKSPLGTDISNYCLAFQESHSILSLLLMIKYVF